MPKWTKEQEQAIYIRDGNVIVSAGAGSGKTAVLTERVYQMIKEGYGLDEFIVLTFTNAAAFEMRERIRLKLLQDPKYQEIADEVDTSYIMTFDAFALSLVKKYHYLLGLDPDISICDESLVTIQKYHELDKILDELYDNPPPAFEHFIYHFLIRDDRLLKETILKIDKMVDLKIDEEQFFNTYFDVYYNEEKVKEDLDELLRLMKREIEFLLEAVNKLELDKDRERIIDFLTPYSNAKSFDEMCELLKVHFEKFQFPKKPPSKKGELDEEHDYKTRREKIKKNFRKLVEIAYLGSAEEAIDGYLSTREDVEFCLELVKKLRQKMNVFKRKNHIFTFNDIAKFALKIIDFEVVKDNLQKKIKTVMVDEYQDTSDIQDYFLSKISNNNLYMVGDIKQSIYRFRNANCQLFLDKYEKYARHEGGIKIDLNQNFRSRPEVIGDINKMFVHLMSLEYGGANYAKDHIILAGNKAYTTTGKTDEDYNVEVVHYYDQNNRSLEYEISLIAEDILSKVHRFPVFDKSSEQFHPANYRDFVILVERKTKFDLYKRIFEEYKIPISIEKDESLISSQAVIVLSNLLKVYSSINKKTIDSKFEHAYASIYRSFLYCGDDTKLEQIVINKSYQDDELYQQIALIANKTKDHSLSTQVRELLLQTDFEAKLARIGNVALNEKKVEQLLETINTMEQIGYGMDDFLLYLENLNSFSLELTSSYQDDGSDSVRLMSIHKSKGLEFPIVYYSELNHDFNVMDTKSSFIASKDYGVIIPSCVSKIPLTFYHYLVRKKETINEISEKIRLFYVALTRAKEKMILFHDDKTSDPLSIPYARSLDNLLFNTYIDEEKYKFGDVLGPGPMEYDETLCIETEQPIEIKEHNIPLQEKQLRKRASLDIDNVDQSLLDFGTELHFLLEIIDWNNPDLSFVKDAKQKRYLQAFIESDLVKKHQHDTIYHEYSYYDSINHLHGIIDLLIVNEKAAIVIDFKTASLDEKKYRPQLKTYQEYVERVFKKPCSLYLYSIIKGQFLKIE